jgi:hypothetical protein
MFLFGYVKAFIALFIPIVGIGIAFGILQTHSRMLFDSVVLLPVRLLTSLWRLVIGPRQKPPAVLGRTLYFDAWGRPDWRIPDPSRVFSLLSPFALSAGFSSSHALGQAWAEAWRSTSDRVLRSLCTSHVCESCGKQLLGIANRKHLPGRRALTKEELGSSQGFLRCPRCSADYCPAHAPSSEASCPRCQLSLASETIEYVLPVTAFFIRSRLQSTTTHRHDSYETLSCLCDITVHYANPSSRSYVQLPLPEAYAVEIQQHLVRIRDRWWLVTGDPGELSPAAVSP